MAALANIADVKELVQGSQLHTGDISRVKNLVQEGQESVDLQVKQSHAQRKPQYGAVKSIRIPEIELGAGDRDRDHHKYAELWRYSDAQTQYYNQALTDRRKVLGPEHSDTLMKTMHDTGDTLRQTVKTDHAEELYEEAIETRSRLGDPKVIQSMRALVNMSLDWIDYFQNSR
ncbi:unnamed protein product [Clonostachys rosea]|uniref:Uncharacterized protein n=1 Tax=Bionectria ochroleuca TaxID=29856 RepID=A0ABY6ULB7_BIOOC|nr:unnamed protein product [Clonostachys rosea]